MVKIKRIYDDPEPGDGYRVLVDRLWPRGVRRDDAEIADWLRDLAPSDELRVYFGHDPAKWDEFRQRYARELEAPARQELLRELAARAKARTVTLLYAARDTASNNAVVVKEALEGMLSKTR